MDWRSQQLSSFIEPVVFKQDHDLIEYIKQNSVTQAVAHGDVDYFKPYVEFVEGPADFGIYICNEEFEFNILARQVNDFLNQSINPKGILYLAINKFLARPVNILPDSQQYDSAILDFFALRLMHTIEQYNYCAEDNGSYFNFAHPLTRFYIRRCE